MFFAVQHVLATGILTVDLLNFSYYFASVDQAVVYYLSVALWLHLSLNGAKQAFLTNTILFSFIQ